MTTISLNQLVEMHTDVECLFVYFENLPRPLENDAFHAKLALINTRVKLKFAIDRLTSDIQVEVTA
jgi:hypothetical protein